MRDFCWRGLIFYQLRTTFPCILISFQNWRNGPKWPGRYELVPIATCVRVIKRESGGREEAGRQGCMTNNRPATTTDETNTNKEPLLVADYGIA